MAEPLTDLKERVERAEGPDRELDKALFSALEPEKAALTAYAGPIEGTAPAYMAPLYTASLDAVVALAERMSLDQHDALDVVLGAISNMVSEYRYRPDKPLSDQLARAIVVEILSALTTEPSHG